MLFMSFLLEGVQLSGFAQRMYAQIQPQLRSPTLANISLCRQRFLTLNFHVCLVLNLWHGSLDMTFHLDLYLHRASNVKYVAFTQNCLLLQHPMVCRYFTTKTTTRLEAEVTNNTGLTLREFLITDPIPIQKCLSM